jgi:hypothetical protein
VFRSHFKTLAEPQLQNQMKRQKYMGFYALGYECQAWKDIRQRDNTFCGYFQHKSEKVNVIKQTTSQYGFRNKDDS